MKKILALAGVILTLSACSNSGAEEKETLRISAAASLMDALEEFEPHFNEAHPDTELVINYGSSTKLRTQIEQGAPFDLFLSASEQDMDEAAESGLVDGKTVVPFAENRLVLVSASETSRSAEDLLAGTDGNIAVGEPESVPLGRYTKESLEALDVWGQLDGRFVYGKDARQVLTYAESGNTEFAIVYRSDASLSDKVEVVGELPAGKTPIIYPAGIAAEPKNPEAAAAFLELLTGDEGRGIIDGHGFTVPEEKE